MVRTLIFSAFAAALLLAATVLAPSSAEACISCSYTPEVAKTPHPGARKAKPKQAARERVAPAPKKRYAKPRQPTPVAPAAPVVAEPDVPESKPTSTARSEPAEQPEPSKSDSSDSVSTAKLDGDNSSSNEPSPRSDASSNEPPVAEEPPAKLDCKRFSPTAGAVVAVPCE